MRDQVGHTPRDGGILPGRSGAAEKANDSAHVAVIFQSIEEDQLVAAAKNQIKTAPDTGIMTEQSKRQFFCSLRRYRVNQI
jgi:hypothetical protein